MSTILNNLKDTDSEWGFYAEAPSTKAGLGSQFRLYSAATLSRVKVKLRKTSGDTPPAGSFVAQIRASYNGNFRDPNDYADALIAQSTNTVEVSAVSLNLSEYEFIFADVELSPGVYFVVLYSADFAQNDGSLRVAVTSSAGAAIGYVTFWFEFENRWGSFMEWD